MYGGQLRGDTGGRVENGGGLSRRRQEKAIRQTIKSAGITSLIVALLSSGCVIAFSEPISRWILKDISCRGYLVIMAIAVPFAAVHTCVGGYFYGIRHTAVPAVTQLLEQVVRV